MVIVVQLVRMPDCGSGGRRFESGLSPKSGRTDLWSVSFALTRGLTSQTEAFR